MVMVGGGGRFTVKKYAALIRLFTSIYNLLPRYLKSLFFTVSTCFSGNLALLIRYAFLCSVSAAVGKSVFVGRFVVIKNFYNARLGENLSIHDMCYIDAQGGLVIGDNVSIAHQTSILTFNHTWDDGTLPIKYNPVVLKPVVIKDDVWIGCGVRIMPGVTIGNRSVVAAGSVVTKDVPAGTLVAGVPARVIRSIV